MRIGHFVPQADPLVKRSYQMAIERIEGDELVFRWVYCCQLIGIQLVWRLLNRNKVEMY